MTLSRTVLTIEGEVTASESGFTEYSTMTEEPPFNRERWQHFSVKSSTEKYCAPSARLSFTDVAEDLMGKRLRVTVEVLGEDQDERDMAAEANEAANRG